MKAALLFFLLALAALDGAPAPEAASNVASDDEGAICAPSISQEKFREESAVDPLTGETWIIDPATGDWMRKGRPDAEWTDPPWLISSGESNDIKKLYWAKEATEPLAGAGAPAHRRLFWLGLLYGSGGLVFLIAALKRVRRILKRSQYSRVLPIVPGVTLVISDFIEMDQVRTEEDSAAVVIRIPRIPRKPSWLAVVPALATGLLWTPLQVRAESISQPIPCLGIFANESGHGTSVLIPTVHRSNRCEATTNRGVSREGLSRQEWSDKAPFQHTKALLPIGPARLQSTGGRGALSQANSDPFL